MNTSYSSHTMGGSGNGVPTGGRGYMWAWQCVLMPTLKL